MAVVASDGSGDPRGAAAILTITLAIGVQRNGEPPRQLVRR